MDRDRLNVLYEQAACREAPPRLFDAVDPRQAVPALAYCSYCQVIPLCRAVVRPSRTFYDGVAAASVWRNGRSVASLTRDTQTRNLVSAIQGES